MQAFSVIALATRRIQKKKTLTRARFHGPCFSSLLTALAWRSRTSLVSFVFFCFQDGSNEIFLSSLISNSFTTFLEYSSTVFLRDIACFASKKKLCFQRQDFAQLSAFPRLDSVRLRVMIVASTKINTTLHIFSVCFSRNERVSRESDQALTVIQF